MVPLCSAWLRTYPDSWHFPAAEAAHVTLGSMQCCWLSLQQSSLVLDLFGFQGETAAEEKLPRESSGAALWDGAGVGGNYSQRCPAVAGIDPMSTP